MGQKGAEPKNQDCATDQNEFLLVRGALKGIHKDGVTTTNYSTMGRHLASCQESGLPLSYDPEILREYFDKLPGLQFQRFLGWVEGGDFSHRFDHGSQCLFMEKWLKDLVLLSPSTSMAVSTWWFDTCLIF